MKLNDIPTPAEIVAHLDTYIVGQAAAKKSVAIALRNRWRRQNVEGDLRAEIMPNNIIMIGPTGVGKTEIARRLSEMARAPFIKVEASKFTEVGYVGRDVESMIRDLVDIGVNMVKNEHSSKYADRAADSTEDRLLDLLLGPPPRRTAEPDDLEKQSLSSTREKFRKMLQEGHLEDREVELDAPQRTSPVVEIFSPQGMEELGVNFQEMFSGLMPQKTRRRKMKIKDARRYIHGEELDKLINMDDVISEALMRVQDSGIVFVDEIDKIVGEGNKHGPDVSREGVQRDILPIVEGCAVMTKYGMVRTDHILFIAAGAFHAAKPSDLVPELQGRFPIRVELDSLTAEDFERILTEPQAALLKQYHALLQTEDVDLIFEKEAVKTIALFAEKVNSSSENIGARRLQTVMTTLLEDILFEPPKTRRKVTITAKKVEKVLSEIIEDEDLSRYIL